MSKTRVAVIGVGHLGKEHARILASSAHAELIGVADIDGEQARRVARKTGSKAYTEYWPLMNLVDAAVIAVPTSEHFVVAKEFLKRGIPLLIEKPLAPTLEQARELVELGRRHEALLQVGHIERFNPVVLDLEKRRFRPKFVDGQRLGTFTGRSLDVGVVLDLMIHDLDLLLALVKAPVEHIEAVGLSIINGHEDLANARLTFANGCVANLTASRASVKPLRKMRVFSPEGYVSLDFSERRATIIQPSEKVRYKGLDIRDLDLSMIGLLKEKLFGHYLQIGEFDMNHGDQLTRELEHFLQCVQTGTEPKVSGEDGLNAVELASRIIDKINAHQWEGNADGPVGPANRPLPVGALFGPHEEAA